jgi:AraC-like DNA-binding protein
LPKAEEPISDFTGKLLSYLERHYPHKVSIREMSAHIGCTPFQLIRLSRKTFGVTPHALLLQVRIRHAVALIEGGGAIASAAVDVGFCDQSHFTKHFKRVQGTPPGRFRAASRAEQSA